jgi:hypothetical protein
MCTRYNGENRISLFYEPEKNNFFVIIGENFDLLKTNDKTSIIINEDLYLNNYIKKLYISKKNTMNNFYVKKDKLNNLFLVYNEDNKNNEMIILPRFKSLLPLYNYMAYFPPSK